MEKLKQEIYEEFGKELGDLILIEIGAGMSVDAAIQEVLSRYMP